MMHRLQHKVAVVTGASSGIGRSIATGLAGEGVDVALLARKTERLKDVAHECIQLDAKARIYEIDLLDDTRFGPLITQISEDFGGIDILVHSAGMFAAGNVADATLRDFDLLYQCNLRAPFALTQLFLPVLRERQGQIVFINSTAGFMAAAGVSQYAAMKHALKGFADSLREEVNPLGVRVISVFPGRTATAMQAKVHELEGKDYQAGELIQPGQVADAVIGALVMGREAEVTEIRLRPMLKPRPGQPLPRKR
jgi:NADP-dependent 3-hydroxy acid dehydrogenase YdfG